MNSVPESIGSDLSKPLAAAAGGYLEIGLGIFHRTKRTEIGQSQAAIGNLAVGIDLAIKALLVRTDPALAFKDLPIEARTMLAAGSAAKGFNGRPYELDLRDFSFEPVSSEDAVRAFYVFFLSINKCSGRILNFSMNYGDCASRRLSES